MGCRVNKPLGLQQIARECERSAAASRERRQSDREAWWLPLAAALGTVVALSALVYVIWLIGRI